MESENYEKTIDYKWIEELSNSDYILYKKDIVSNQQVSAVYTKGKTYIPPILKGNYFTESDMNDKKGVAIVGKEILKSLENAITVVALFEGEDVSTTFDKINMISRNFNSKENSIDTVTLVENNNLVNVCLVGFGKRELLNREKIRIIGGNLCKKLKNI